jgi:hypothetical protein
LIMMMHYLSWKKMTVVKNVKRSLYLMNLNN